MLVNGVSDTTIFFFLFLKFSVFGGKVSSIVEGTNVGRRRRDRSSQRLWTEGDNEETERTETVREIHTSTKCIRVDVLT